MRGKKQEKKVKQRRRRGEVEGEEEEEESFVRFRGLEHVSVAAKHCSSALLLAFIAVSSRPEICPEMQATDHPVTAG